MILSRSFPIALTFCKSRLSGHSCPLLLLTHLKDIKLQIIRIPRSPQDRMIRRLRPKLHLSQSLMHILRRLPDRLCEELLIHEMGTRTCRQISAILHQFHPPQIDLPVTLHRFFDRTSRFCKCRRIKVSPDEEAGQKHPRR